MLLYWRRALFQILLSALLTGFSSSALAANSEAFNRLLGQVDSIYLSPRGQTILNMAPQEPQRFTLLLGHELRHQMQIYPSSYAPAFNELRVEAERFVTGLAQMSHEPTDPEFLRLLLNKAINGEYERSINRDYPGTQQIAREEIYAGIPPPQASPNTHGGLSGRSVTLLRRNAPENTGGYDPIVNANDLVGGTLKDRPTPDQVAGTWHLKPYRGIELFIRPQGDGFVGSTGDRSMVLNDQARSWASGQQVFEVRFSRYCPIPLSTSGKPEAICFEGMARNWERKWILKDYWKRIGVRYGPEKAPTPITLKMFSENGALNLCVEDDCFKFPYIR